MSDNPLQLMLDSLNKVSAEVAKIGPANAQTRSAVATSNEETRKAVSDELAALRGAVSDEIAKQGQAFGEMRAHHAETLKAAKAAPAWAVSKAVLYVTGGLVVLVLICGLILQASGQVHIAIGPAAGFCATRPVEQPNGGHACWETPPKNEEAAERLDVCLEAPWSIHYNDRTHPDHGRMACWTEPPHPPKPSPERDG